MDMVVVEREDPDRTLKLIDKELIDHVQLRNVRKLKPKILLWHTFYFSVSA